MRMGWGKTTKFVMPLVCVGLFWMAGVESACAQMIFQAYNKPQAAPEFSLTDLQGKRVDSREFRGQVIFLNFWATW
jgi:hypothetical protein